MCLCAAELPYLPGYKRGIHDVSGTAGSAAGRPDPTHTDHVPGSGADLDGDPVPPGAAGKGSMCVYLLVCAGI